MQINNNLPNLQQTLSQSGTAVANYSWLADGTKCAVVDNTTNGFDYLGSLIYSRSGSTRTLESTDFGGGRIVYSGGTYNPYYYITDHLGSVRVITDNSGAIQERNDYYPFGGKHANVNYPQFSVNKQKFNGKELQTTGSTGFLDYGARMYDDVIGRWSVVDPLGEKIIGWSPYTYAFNNTVRFIDYFGLIPLSKVVDNIGMSSKFGLRTHPITGKLHGHGGVDFRTDGTGHVVRSLADGIVTKVGWNEKYDSDGNKIGYGRYIIVEHKDGYQSLYGHLEYDGVNVKKGDKIKDGETIGTSGNTGGSTGPHVHVEIGKGDILKKENKINPESIKNLQTMLYGEKKQESGTTDFVQNTNFTKPILDLNIFNNLKEGKYKLKDGKVIPY